MSASAAAPASAADTAALAGKAAQAAKAGNAEEAARLWAAVLEQDPNHPQALLFLAARAVGRGDAAGARRMLERAVAAKPDDPMLWLNLAGTCAAARDAEGEWAALDRALALQPRWYVPLLRRGMLLERMGRPRDAARAFDAALAVAPPGDAVAPHDRAALQHAAQAVARDRTEKEAFLRARIDAARRAVPDGEARRFDECLDILTGKAKVYVQEPVQFHYPRLPAIPFLERSGFPWLDAVEAATGDIRRELMAVLAEDQEKLVPYIDYPDSVPLDQWRELNHSARWSAFHLLKNGLPVPENAARCPKTMAALAGAPGPDVPGRTPVAMFSLLKPRTRIPPHTGVANTRLVVHLPLIVPPGCGFRVGNEVRQWEVGKAWVFDDTIEHEAWNDSDELRVILIFDIWHPMLSEAERTLVRSLMQGIDAYEGVAAGMEL
ncbi:MAG TPA: aspartyl/asparaginyl beta-hydroxylase domain-containing protein [Azospirillaceae bacterium]|nr:aspartyl/asparaginyl beta-hydroxylase domain-containing protein [Azospirillaceae bacterium]